MHYSDARDGLVLLAFVLKTVGVAGVFDAADIQENRIEMLRPVLQLL